MKKPPDSPILSHNTEIQNHLISREITAFLIDRQARRLSPRTLQFYSDELNWFSRYLASQSISSLHQLTPHTIRLYLIHLSSTRSPGGQSASFRALKAFLNWYEIEVDDPHYHNPIRKITAPKTSKEPLPGLSLPHLHALLNTCDRTLLGQRDRALLLTLLDTGLRRNELLSLDLNHIDLRTGQVNLQSGKGAKPRTVYLGARTRREIIRYLRLRKNVTEQSPLFAVHSGTRLTPAGLRQVLRRRSAQAGIPEPQIHDFRRLFAIQSLRNGLDLITLMHLMGHTSTAVLQRYLKLVDTDLQSSHQRTSPVDNL